jgi:Family of unknown function (DUF5331)
MNVEQLRRSLKTQWLSYYRDNRPWLTRLGVWVDCGEHRRPSSSFILGTLSTLEPQLIHLLPLIVDLSNNPDRIVVALGLNFNPETELKTLESQPIDSEQSVKMLPSSPQPSLNVAPSAKHSAKIDEECQGTRSRRR